MIKIIDIEKNPTYYKECSMPKETFCENSFSIGNDTIILGKYKDKHRKILSYYHELGHIKNNNKFTVSVNPKLGNEISAWIYSIKNIKYKNISKNNVLYILECLESYINRGKKRAGGR